VVDDNVDLCDIIAAELTDEGFEVSRAYSGNQAITILSKELIEVVLSDIKMPEGSGIDLLKYVSGMSERIPKMIMMTGYADVLTSELLALGACAVLHKPVVVEKLCKDLDNLLAAA
jgi:DNA-binding NtrC family response regulator